MMLTVPHGPYRISRNGQVVLGKEVLEATGLNPGDSVYLVPGGDPSGGILVIPTEVAARWFEKGRKAEQEADAGKPEDPVLS